MADDSEIYPSEIQQRRTVSRRSFLVVAGAATAGGLVATRSPSRLMDLFTGTPEDFATPVVNPQSRNFGIDTYVRRADDMLNLRFEFYNLKLDKSDPQNPKLVPVTAGQPAAVVAVFPPQSLAEQAFFEEVPPTGSTSGDTFQNGGEDPNNPAAPSSSDPPNNSQPTSHRSPTRCRACSAGPDGSPRSCPRQHATATRRVTALLRFGSRHRPRRRSRCRGDWSSHPTSTPGGHTHSHQSPTGRRTPSSGTQGLAC
jgi:hypothetical protein